MNEHPLISKILLVINSLGCGAYLYWLIFANKRIFYTQEGVLYLLPFLPFFFVYIYIFGKPIEDNEKNQDAEDESAETDEVKEG